MASRSYTAFEDLFGLPIGPASACKRQASTAEVLAPIAAEALEFARRQPAANVDETSWNRC